MILVMKATRPLYGILESGFHWYLTYHSHDERNLKMTQVSFDNSLLYKSSQGTIQGLTTRQVDDSFGHASDKCLELEEFHPRQFQKMNSKPHQLLQIGQQVEFNGSNIQMKNIGEYVMHQTEKLKSLSEVQS